MHAFKEDCGIGLQLGKCQIYLKGMPIEEARSIVRETRDADQRLHTLSVMLQLHDDQESNVIQVDGITYAGVPIRSPDFVTAFVKSKTAQSESAPCSHETHAQWAPDCQGRK